MFSSEEKARLIPSLTVREGDGRPGTQHAQLMTERPRLVIAFHDHFAPASGGTSDMALRAVLRDVPVWLVPGWDVTVGIWVRLGVFPADRTRRVAAELPAADERQSR